MKKGLMILVTLLTMTSIVDAVTLKRSVFGSAGASIQTASLSMKATGGQAVVGRVEQPGSLLHKIGF